MNNFFCSLSIALFIVVMTNHSETMASDKDLEYRSLIVGIWDVVPESDSDFLKRTKIFKEKGIKVKKTYIEREFKDDGTFLRRFYDSIDKNNCTSTIEGKWWVESGMLYRFPNKIDGREQVFRKEPFVEKVIDVSNDEMTLKDERGNIYKNNKVKR